MSDNKPELKLIAYTDGGCRPTSRGFGGYGFHGYLTDCTPADKSVSAPATHTTRGYVDKKDLISSVIKNEIDMERLANTDGPIIDDVVVMPIAYVDVWASIENEATNNIAEIMAMSALFEYVLERDDITTLLVYGDSTYVKKGLNEWCEKWIKNGWKRADGEEVSNRNEWETLISLRNKVVESDIDLNIDWVRGHSGNVGNGIADVLATRGVFMASKGDYDRHIEISDVKGYWHGKVDYNRLLSKTSWYFSTNTGEGKSPCGRFVYHMAKEKIIGKKDSESSYSVVFIKESDPVLDKVREYQNIVSDGCENSIIAVDFGAVRTPKNYLDILKYGYANLYTPTEENRASSIINAYGAQLTQEQKPARLAYRAVDYLITLEQMLNRYINMSTNTGDGGLSVTDITSMLFNSEENKDKLKCSLRKEIATDVRKMRFNVNYDTGINKGTVDVDALFDMDLPSRNTLSAVASKCPTVKIITWPESDTSVRIASVMEVDGEIGIWSTIHSNLRLID